VAAGQAVLNAGGSALDAVTEAVRLLEDCPLFNAGHGAVYTSEGRHELDACVMNGADLASGAVACVTAAQPGAGRARRDGKERARAAGGPRAEAFAARNGVARARYFHTDARHEQWLRARAARDAGPRRLLLRLRRKAAATEPIDPDHKFGTVGAVALDQFGNLAAATSTGGITNKQPGRVGDSPIIGAGCYANNATVAVSATGTGEAFMRTVACYDIGARMAYAGQSLEEASAPW
jgi:beta-aspartyl-peptidase (threonine type)